MTRTDTDKHAVNVVSTHKLAEQLSELVSDQPLKGKRIMVTRPAHQATRLCDYIKQAGGEAYVFPALAIADTPHAAHAKAALTRLDDIDILIFISPNAVQYGLHYINTLPAHLQTAAVGAGSAQALVDKLGRPVDIVPSAVFTSEALLAEPGLLDVTGKNILILRGNGGRSKLADSLRERGATVEYVEVYQRVLPVADNAQLALDWQQQAMDVIIVSSGEGLRNLPQLVGEHLQTRLFTTQLLVVNARLQSIATQLGFSATITIAEKASDVAILQSLIETQNKQDF